LEVELPDGKRIVNKSPSTVRHDFGKEQAERFRAHLQATWKLVVTAPETADQAVQTTLTVEQYLSISYGGKVFPAKETDAKKQTINLQKQGTKALQRIQKYDAEVKAHEQEITNLKAARMQPEKKRALIQQAENRRNASQAKLDGRTAHAKRIKEKLKGGQLFWQQIILGQKDKAIHYRVYVQYEDGQKFDLIRTRDEGWAQIGRNNNRYAVLLPQDRPWELSDWFVPVRVRHPLAQGSR
ncbi:MAG: hypothetical protein P8K78_08240, partial [Pirellulales bacterium]|nr:hypothetical protein [Pirellulales bacterium]